MKRLSILILLVLAVSAGQAQVNVHLSKSTYIPGEKVRGVIYVDAGLTNQYLQCDLVDHNGTLASSVLTRFNTNDRGLIALDIPDSIPGSMYYLRLHNNENVVFEKPIWIIGNGPHHFKATASAHHQRIPSNSNDFIEVIKNSNDHELLVDLKPFGAFKNASISVVDKSFAIPDNYFPKTNSNEIGKTDQTLKLRGKVIKSTITEPMIIAFLDRNTLNMCYTRINDDQEFEIAYSTVGAGDKQVLLWNALGQIDFTAQIDLGNDKSASFDRQDNINFHTLEDSILHKVDKNYQILKIADQFSKRDDASVANAAMVSEYDYSTADKSFYFRKYKFFPDLYQSFQVLFSVIKVKDSLVRVYSQEYKRSLNDAPLFIVDGIPVSDVNELLGSNTSMFESVNIINSLEKLQRFGPVARGGIIALKTYHNYYRHNYTPSIISIPKVQNYHEIIAHNESKTPNLRLKSLVYWNAELKNATLKVLLNDTPSTYELIIYLQKENNDVEVITTAFETK